ncbi:DAK2 domain-containing protein [Microaceticoccus formicicus]|uniref:DAK2 domain-containing protein n=1 Tax=Microaceticoccus formicicus TaxID=3118105 RepID=UPI003CD03497|nr:DAK2 domain-containing protein [Peptoniphilaceae bacterium AMB_02]
MKTIDGQMLSRGFRVSVQMLENKKEEVNALNVFPVPDGDTGTNMSLTIASALKSVNAVTDLTVGKVSKAASSGSLMGARGNSGVILSQLLRGFSMGLTNLEEANITDLNRAFNESARIAYNAVMKPTEGTILTVARMMAEFSEKNHNDYDDIMLFFQDVIKEGYRVLDLTPDMLPQLKEAGVVDAGGKGYLIILEGLLQGLISDDYDYKPTVDSFNTFANKAHSESENIEFGYCTEFMINRSDGKYLELRETLSNYGDSLIVVADDEITKVHIHTNNPGEVLELALKIGPLSDIKIDNMRLQNEKLQDAGMYEDKKEVETEKSEYAFIAVSSGDGLNDVFKDLNAKKVISGGQTMNPSTEDFLKAMEEINAENIYILPNNKNIILAANQAVELTDRNAFVIKTTTIPQGFAALLSFDQDASVKENLKNMSEAIEEVKTLQVTYAVRDSENNGIKINKGDFIGLLNGNIVLSTSEILETCLSLVDKSIDEDDSLITIFYGADTDEKVAEELVKRIEEKYGDFDVELVKGNQPVYYFIISVE